MTNKASEHQQVILEQFTKQAVPFSQMQNHSPELLLAASGARADDIVLDVACGPGLILFFNSHPSFFDASPYLIRQALDQSQDPGATPANKYLDFLDF